MQDPYGDISIDELSKKLPAYYYMGDKEKKNYFKKMTKKYMKKMRKNIKKGGKRLRFDLPGIKVKSKTPKFLTKFLKDSPKCRSSLQRNSKPRTIPKAF